MMAKVLGFLQAVKLSLTQWLLVMAAAAIGVLILKLKLQGGQLHAAQVKLLEAQTDEKLHATDDAVAAARTKFEAAKKAFEEAT